jgi:Rhodopirellula transposase DDE domain
MILNDTVKATVKDAAQKLTGYRKRDFMAKVAEDYFSGSARKAETVLGWNRNTVQLGLHERRTELICLDNYGARGRHRIETVLPNIESDIRAMVDVESQADPKFQSTFLYTKISARAVREKLVHEKGYDSAQLPTRQTIGSILNRMGYRLKKHKKQNP